jgi:histidinol-phosphate aminotransferase
MLAQTAAAASVRDTKYLKKTVTQIINTRDKTTKALKQMGYNVLDTQANFIFFEAPDAPALYKFLYEKKILARHWNKPRIKNFMRVSIGTDEEMETFVNAVKEFWQPSKGGNF